MNENSRNVKIQNCDHESAATQKYKMAAMTSSNSKFQKPRKMTLANICQIICGKFHQNRFIRLGCRDDTHIQTHRHTHTHTHTLSLIATYSVKMTEYKNPEPSNKKGTFIVYIYIYMYIVCLFSQKAH